MTDLRTIAAPPARPDFVQQTLDTATIGEIRRKLSLAERIGNVTLVRRLSILVVLALLWQGYAAALGDDLILPSLSEVATALWRETASGELPARVLATLRVLVVGYAAGVTLAAVVSGLAVSTRIGADLLSILTAMLNPLPAVALLPVALLWFGLGTPSLVFVLINSVAWPVALNAHSGFLAVPETLRMAGSNYGLTGIRQVIRILIPAAFPAILAGLKIGWAFAWRTLIASELVFGASSRSGGLGWFIAVNRNALEVANVFAGLLTIILIGLLVETIVFRTVEIHTVRKWGMQR